MTSLNGTLVFATIGGLLCSTVLAQPRKSDRSTPDSAALSRAIDNTGRGGPMFDPAKFGTAIEATKNSGKPLILVIPHQFLRAEESAALRDPRVQAALNDFAYLFVEGIDNRIGAIRKSLKDSWPWTGVPLGTYAIRDGTLFDHDVVFNSADDLLAWLACVKSGTMPANYIEKRAGDRTDEIAPLRRMIYADRLERWFKAEPARHAQAADEYTWVYETLHTPRRLTGESAPAQKPPTQEAPTFHLSMDCYAATFTYDYESKVRKYAEEFPAVQSRVAVVRDRLRERLANQSQVSNELFRDWLFASGVVPDAAAAVQLYTSLRNSPNTSEFADKAQPAIVNLLCDTGAWAQAGGLIDTPMIRVHRLFDQIRVSGIWNPMGTGDIRKDDPPAYRRMILQAVAASANMHAALLAAARDQDAFDVAATVLDLAQDDSLCKLLLVSAALEAKQPRKEHLLWAREADADPHRTEGAPLLTPSIEDALKGK